MDFSDAAKYLEVSRPTVYALVEEERLHPVTIGKVRYLLVTELARIKRERG